MRKRHFKALLALLAGFPFALGGPRALSAERVALVVGNQTYVHTASLRNPLNDAADVSVRVASPRIPGNADR